MVCATCRCSRFFPALTCQAGRFTLWSLARDALRAWDGLRSVDWIGACRLLTLLGIDSLEDHEMIHRQSQYSSFRQIKLLVCTWNIDSARPSDLAGSEANSRFLDELLHSVDSPDVIVFGFQEVIPLTDKKLTASASICFNWLGLTGLTS